ncbi:hypothetical protein [Chitinophaga flava]|uniref:Uncharacterized protein n=1 Tax=Chitinophaga flava TaxID=2259036 RepID=A0A365Y0S9_9BACT|nr:hypothetical protein [Chitinophaga flava]RBL91445.1 hypothetical protein DF182_02170 [Chitinophaga flava]
MKLKLLVTSVWLVLFLSVYAGNDHQLIFCGSTHNDLYHLSENRWEYRASNAGIGRGAWNTLAARTQSRIVAVRVPTIKPQSFRDLFRQSNVKAYMNTVTKIMFEA